jgi:glycoprotein endo-alpha-1,2-mannosidase
MAPPLITNLLSNVLAFHYLWYGEPATDGRWLHWNHSVLPHWTKEVQARYPHAAFLPPHDIHAPFYPGRGPYSSRDPTILAEHMMDMATHGIGGAVLSWWGRPGVSRGDSQGVVTDAVMRDALDAAAAAGVRVALHLEPYVGRSVESVRDDLAYLHAECELTGGGTGGLERLPPHSFGLGGKR